MQVKSYLMVQGSEFRTTYKLKQESKLKQVSSLRT